MLRDRIQAQIRKDSDKARRIKEMLLVEGCTLVEVQRETGWTYREVRKYAQKLGWTKACRVCRLLPMFIRKVPVSAYQRIRTGVAAGLPCTYYAREYGVSRQRISQIAKINPR